MIYRFIMSIVVKGSRLHANMLFIITNFTYTFDKFTIKLLHNLLSLIVAFSKWRPTEKLFSIV